MKTNKLLFIMLLIACFVCLVNLPAVADESENYLEIYTAEEFLTFSQMCIFDAYSLDKTVMLMADIDLTGIDFEEIPIFLGIFEGNGYTISGLEVDQNKDTQGLFRHLAEGAVITNLNVVGTTVTENNYIGGIVAENYGTIENCSYNGIVSGIDTVGGIAANNYGTIINCSVSGGLFGETQVGGIAGNNSGTIIRCSNFAEVNTNISNFSFTFEDSIVANINLNSDEVSITNIGGIAGESTGIIQNCTNYATVGYSHVGYNIGGIVGKQSGYVVDCENSGMVQGRKEVGGIVGQFEPYVDTLYSTSKLETLRVEVAELSRLTSVLTSDADDINSVLNNEFTQLNTAVDETSTQVENLLNQTEDIINANIDSVNQISVTVANTLDAFVPIAESIDPIISNLSQATSDLEDMSADITDALEELEDLEGIANTVSTNLSRAQDNIDAGLTYLQSSVSELSDFSSDDLDIDILTEMINGIGDNLGLAFDEFLEASENIERALDSLEYVGPILGASNEALQDATENLESAFGNINDALGDLDDTNELVNDLIEDLANEDEIVFTKTDETYEATKDLLSTSVDEVMTSLEDINFTLSASGDTLIFDLEEINLQLAVVFDLMIDIMQDVSNVSYYTSIEVEDISTWNTDDIYAGKVTNCENTGYIEGDINIGGIAGAISFEVESDMEDDLTNDATQSVTRQALAIIENCINSGDVVAKKDGAGGIVGYQEFGLVDSSSFNGDLSSTEGSYVGGIAGESAGYIQNCYVKANISGGQYVGGIVGAGYYVDGCYSLANIEATKGDIGGIVGELETQGTIKNNFFVTNTLGGIDGISFSGKAESISYEDLISIEGIPEFYQYLTLKFIIDDTLIEMQTFNYNDSLANLEMPQISEKTGYFSKWEEVESEYITMDMKIYGEYLPMLTTIAGEKNSLDISEILVDGLFTETESLVVREITTSEGVYAQYSLYVKGDLTEISKIRYLAPEIDVEIEVFQNGAWSVPNTQLDGKYIVIELDEAMSGEVQFRVIEKIGINIYLYLAIFMVCLLITFVALKKHRNRMQPKNKKVEN